MKQRQTKSQRFTLTLKFIRGLPLAFSAAWNSLKVCRTCLCLCLSKFSQSAVITTQLKQRQSSPSLSLCWWCKLYQAGTGCCAINVFGRDWGGKWDWDCLSGIVKTTEEAAAATRAPETGLNVYDLCGRVKTPSAELLYLSSQLPLHWDTFQLTPSLLSSPNRLPVELCSAPHHQQKQQQQQ